MRKAQTKLIKTNGYNQFDFKRNVPSSTTSYDSKNCKLISSYKLYIDLKSNENKSKSYLNKNPTMTKDISTSHMNLDQELFNEKSLQKTSSNNDTAIILISSLLNYMKIKLSKDLYDQVKTEIKREFDETQSRISSNNKMNEPSNNSRNSRNIIKNHSQIAKVKNKGETDLKIVTNSIKEMSLSPLPFYQPKKLKEDKSVPRITSEKKVLKVSYDSNLKNSNIFTSIKQNTKQNKSCIVTEIISSPCKNKGKVITKLKDGNENVKEAVKSSLYNEYKSNARNSQKGNTNLKSNINYNKSNADNSKELNKINTYSYINTSEKNQESERQMKLKPNSSTNSIRNKDINSSQSKFLNLPLQKRTIGANEISINLKLINNESNKKQDDNVKKTIESGLPNKQVNGNISYNSSQDRNFKLLENTSLKQFLDHSGDDVDKPSDSGRHSTKKSEASEKNVFKNDEFLQKKFSKKFIMYPNDFNLDDADENLKNIMFKKNY